MMDVEFNRFFCNLPAQLTDSSAASQVEAPILSATGRIMLALLIAPGMTQRDLSHLLGVSESRVSKAILSLVETKKVVRTRIGRFNVLKIHPEALKNDPDISLILEFARLVT